MDQGDLILQFMHLAEPELSKRLADVEGPRMEAFLELAQRTSTAKADPYKEHFRVTLIPYDLQDQMLRITNIDTLDERDYHLNFENMELPAWEALSFDYEAKWPVSLVLNRKALFCYQMIFRLLFYFKHVERLLCSSIPLGCKSLSPLNGTEAETEDGSGPSTLMLCFALRHKMLHFLQNLQTYIVQEVLKPNWEMFMERMAQVKTVDEVLEFHRDFLDTCLRDCMLTSPELLGALMKILKLSAHFTDLVKKRLSLEVNDGRSLDEATEEFATMFGQEVRTVDLEFNALIFGLLDSLNEAGRRFSENIYKLFFRMDYNNFYMTVIGKMPGGAPGVPVLASSNLELQMF
ncbi:unnamed protein product [Cyprideis torosa]|uniref:Gamma-tubulin complex component n=1 Tax=Cyprideis torosa TaxID=163714 RepID=A0A7R8WJQ2_9CRUS|nr:unnamed protein product [Cyprideis torosa]CAG0902286.1 unnamed protein product [Cyprideis torosa]